MKPCLSADSHFWVSHHRVVIFFSVLTPFGFSFSRHSSLFGLQYPLNQNLSVGRNHLAPHFFSSRIARAVGPHCFDFQKIWMASISTMTNSKMKKRTRTKTQTPALCVLLAVVLASKNCDFAEALSPPSVRSTCTPRPTTNNKLSNAHHSRSQLQQLHLLGNGDDGASGEVSKKKLSFRRDL